MRQAASTMPWANAAIRSGVGMRPGKAPPMAY